MSKSETATLADDFEQAVSATKGSFAFSERQRAMFDLRELCIDNAPAILAALRSDARGEATTPAAKWRAEGKPDPHGNRYDGERAKLTHGKMTDDELANAVYLDNTNIGILTAAKERIRWLSRALESALSTPAKTGERDGAIERAARVCDELAAEHRAAIDPTTGLLDRHRVAANDFEHAAERIRALSSPAARVGGK